MKKNINILLLEDNLNDAELTRIQLQKGGVNFNWLHVSELNSFTDALTDFQPDVILSDYNLIGFTGSDALKIVQHTCPDIPFILITGALKEEIALSLIKEGAYDYVLKDSLMRLPVALNNSLLHKNNNGFTTNAIKQQLSYEKEKRIKSVYESAKIGITYFSTKGEIIDANEITLRFFHLDKNKVLGKTIHEIMPHLADFTMKRIGLALKSTEPLQFEHAFDFEGEKVWVLEIFSSVKDEKGKILGVQMVSINITPQKKTEEQLARVNILLNNTSEMAKMGSWELDLITMEPYFSEEAFKIYGITDSVTPGLEKGLSFYPPESQPIIRKAVKEAIEKKVPYDIEVPFITATGKKIWVRTQGKVHFENEKAIRLFGTIQDITDRKLIEQKLIESERKFKSLYENAPLPYHSLNEDGSFKDVNSTWLSTLGYQRHEVIGKYYKDFLHPQWQAQFEKNFPVLKERGNVNDVLFRIRHKNGTYIDISLEGSVGYNPDGSFKQTYCVFQDITTKKQALENLKNSEQKFRQLFENMTQGVFYQLADGSLSDINDAGLEMFGLSREQFLGKTSYDPSWHVVDENGKELLPEEHPSMQALKSGHAIKNHIVGVYHPIRHDYAWLMVSAIPEFKEGEKEPYQAFVTMHNITERRQRNKDLKESRSKFEILSKVTVEGILIHDNGVPVDMNDALVRLSGYTREELFKSDLIKLLAKEEYISTLYENIANEYPLPYEIIGISKSGKEIPIEVVGKTFISANNRRLRVSAFRDITERKKQDKALAESKAKYEILTNATIEGILIHDKGVPIDMNESFSKMFGYQREELFSIKLVELLPKKEFQDTVYANIKNEYSLPYEIIGVKKDGTEFPLEIEGRTYFNKDGKRLRVTAFRDISERKKAKQEIKKLNEELEQKVIERTAQLEEANKELEKFNTYFVGREFRIKELKDKVKSLEQKLSRDEEN